MKRRLRKKKNLGEFDYKGFELECEFFPHLSEDEVDEFLDEYLEFVEGRNLGSGGGIDASQMGQFVTKHVPCRRKRNGKVQHKQVHCTESDRKAVMEWLEKRTTFKSLVVGPLVGSTSGK